MPVLIGKQLHLTRNDARDGLSNTEIRHLQALYRLGDGNSVEGLMQYPSTSVYAEVRGLFRSRKPFRSDINSEELPEADDSSYEYLLDQLKQTIKAPRPDSKKAHQLVCQMLANGF